MRGEKCSDYPDYFDYIRESGIGNRLRNLTVAALNFSFFIFHFPYALCPKKIFSQKKIFFPSNRK